MSLDVRIRVGEGGLPREGARPSLDVRVCDGGRAGEGERPSFDVCMALAGGPGEGERPSLDVRVCDGDGPAKARPSLDVRDAPAGEGDRPASMAMGDGERGRPGEGDRSGLDVRVCVERAYEKSSAEATVRRVPGVIGVRNEIAVRAAQEVRQAAFHN